MFLIRAHWILALILKFIGLVTYCGAGVTATVTKPSYSRLLRGTGSLETTFKHFMLIKGRMD